MKIKWDRTYNNQWLGAPGRDVEYNTLINSGTGESVAGTPSALGKDEREGWGHFSLFIRPIRSSDFDDDLAGSIEYNKLQDTGSPVSPYVWYTFEIKEHQVYRPGERRSGRGWSMLFTETPFESMKEAVGAAKSQFQVFLEYC